MTFHCRIFRRSYRKVARAEFEPTTTEFWMTYHRDFRSGILVWVTKFQRPKSKHSFLYTNIFFYRPYLLIVFEYKNILYPLKKIEKYKKLALSRDFIQQMAISILTWNYQECYNYLENLWIRIPFRSSYQLSCQAVCSTRTQSKLCTATLILFSHSDQCSDFILVIAFVNHPISLKLSHR